MLYCVVDDVFCSRCHILWLTSSSLTDHTVLRLASCSTVDAVFCGKCLLWPMSCFVIDVMPCASWRVLRLTSSFLADHTVLWLASCSTVDAVFCSKCLLWPMSCFITDVMPCASWRVLWMSCCVADVVFCDWSSARFPGRSWHRLSSEFWHPLHLWRPHFSGGLTV